MDTICSSDTATNCEFRPKVLPCLHYGKDHEPFCSILVSSYVSNTVIYCFVSRFVGAVVAITYMSLLYGTYVPDWEYQTSGPGSIEKSFFVSSTSSFLYAKRCSLNWHN